MGLGVDLDEALVLFSTAISGLLIRSLNIIFLISFSSLEIRAIFSYVLRLSIMLPFNFLFAEAGVQTNGNKRNQVLKIGHGGTLDSAAAGVLGNEKYKYGHQRMI